MWIGLLENRVISKIAIVRCNMMINHFFCTVCSEILSNAGFQRNSTAQTNYQKMPLIAVANGLDILEEVLECL
jgi:hypothetical protein